ncbi:hypothetical protein CDAR_576901 [Caerostris darwini]|uniref:C2H2-type domain-containing protein n=1 Tax=Caerostris darwini TaxID=1538125 RepID=A0AAV4NLI9_9ARAC|nr:hypothetical protein CDAR_576901 [Caerostris darwini]
MTFKIYTCIPNKYQDWTLPSTISSEKEANSSSFQSHLTEKFALNDFYNLKQYKCDVCGKEFTAKCSLKIHLTVHTGELLYKCKKCCLQFRYSSQLSRHKYTCIQE